MIKEDHKPRIPFKFNPQWLMEQEYWKLAEENWKHLPSDVSSSPMKQFANNITKIKSISRVWSKEFTIKQQAQSREVASKIKSLYEGSSSSLFGGGINKSMKVGD